MPAPSTVADKLKKSVEAAKRIQEATKKLGKK